jgi:hypothetical protein
MAVVPSIADDVGMGDKREVGYPTDVTDEEWAFAAPYLTLCKVDAAQRDTRWSRCSTACAIS